MIIIVYPQIQYHMSVNYQSFYIELTIYSNKSFIRDIAVFFFQGAVELNKWYLLRQTPEELTWLQWNVPLHNLQSWAR